MRFEYLSKRYRIVFRHDPSRRWSDHAGHLVRLGRGPIGSGPTVLYCIRCAVFLSHIPKRDRVRKVTCTIYEETVASAGGETRQYELHQVAKGVGRPNAQALVRLLKPVRVVRRDAVTSVLAAGHELWASPDRAIEMAYKGDAEILSSGDRYEREKGRFAALDNALNGDTILGEDRAFRLAAWAAYNGRKNTAKTAKGGRDCL